MESKTEDVKMHWTVKGLIAFVLAWVTVVNIFVMASHAGNVLEQARIEGDPVPWQITAPLYAGAVTGYLADVAFNLSAGSVIYRKLPEHLTFSEESNAILRQGPGRRRDKAAEWCAILDRFDPGHCSNYAEYLQRVQ